MAWLFKESGRTWLKEHGEILQVVKQRDWHAFVGPLLNEIKNGEAIRDEEDVVAGIRIIRAAIRDHGHNKHQRLLRVQADRNKIFDKPKLRVQ